MLIVAALVALIARRLRLPYTVGLVVAGAALALFHVHAVPELTRKLIFHALLPPLLFEAALHIHWSELKRDALPVTLLATVGVLISAAAVAGGMIALLGWPAPSAVIFGVLIAATDPVSVIATFKEAGVTGRLRLLVEAESLANDGVAAVLFSLAVALAVPAAPSALPIGLTLLTLTVGGIAVGLACGGLAVRLAGRTNDHLVETALTTVTAYGSFLLADHLHLSGVLATVTAGLVMGNVGLLCAESGAAFSERGREVVVAFWDFAAFVANSFIFLLIGSRAARIPFPTLGLLAIATAIGLVWLGRAVSVYPLCALLARSRWKVAMSHQHALFWGGLRGALALALALSLPPALPYRDAIVIAAFSVTAFSIVVQGLAMPVLLRRWGLIPTPAATADS